jgi:hypothetical protein
LTGVALIGDFVMLTEIASKGDGGGQQFVKPTSVIP